MAPMRHNVDTLMKRVQEALSKLPPIEVYQPDPKPVIDKVQLSPDDVVVRKVDNKFVIESKWVENLMRSVNFGDCDSLRFFYRVLTRNGVVDKLKNAGVSEGDTVICCGLPLLFL